MPALSPHSAYALAVGGVTPFTAIDFPGRLAAVVFCQGCPLRCGYCQNPELLDAKTPGARPWSDVVAFLDTRRGLIDAVVFSGGEPLVQSALIPAMAQTRSMGFAIGLHTSGVAPARFAAALTQADWVGFDVKAPFDAYERVTRAHGSGAKARDSLDLLARSGVAFEARTTLDPDLLDADDVLHLADDISRMGVAQFALQALRRPDGSAPFPAWARAPAFRAALEQRFSRIEYRGD